LHLPKEQPPLVSRVFALDLQGCRLGAAACASSPPSTTSPSGAHPRPPRVGAEHRQPGTGPASAWHPCCAA